MEVNYVKAEPRGLRDLGLDERWLQDRIEEDPSVLGLGDVSIITRERRQRTGGRIDFLMYDPEEGDLRYEIEVMLGRLDESHIIRTIEYWDLERQRYPALRHRAVIVAEDITSRFFNVIGLLNRAIPIIAIQLGAFQIEDKVVLHFTKVLDLSDSAADDEQERIEGQRDRSFWERKSSEASLGVADKVIAMLSGINGGPRIAYNVPHIAVGGDRRNFCWLHPRQKKSHCLVDVRLEDEERDGWIERLESEGVTAYKTQSGPVSIRVRLTERELAENEATLRELLATASDEARR